MNHEILQQALDALEFPHDSEWSNKAKAIEALQHALAQPEHEPVAKVNSEGFIVELGLGLAEGTKLYTAPPRKEWVGLTDKEILDLWVANHKNTGATDAFACAVEAKLKEKNT